MIPVLIWLLRTLFHIRRERTRAETEAADGYVICTRCGLENWYGYGTCQKCGADLPGLEIR